MKTKQHKTTIATEKSPRNPDLHLQIGRRAYEIWMAGGSRHGEDIVHWLQAENEVLAQSQINT